MFQQNERDENQRLSLVRAVGDQEDDVIVPFLAVLEDLFGLTRAVLFTVGLSMFVSYFLEGPSRYHPILSRHHLLFPIIPSTW
jgi:hypothetical protein